MSTADANSVERYPRGDDPLPDQLTEHWDRFFAHEASRPAGQDVYEAIFSDPLLFPLQRRRELARMMQLARTAQPRVVYEIGSDKGGGLYHWCKCLPTVRRVVACEVRGLPYARQFEEAFPHLDFLWLPRSSYDHATLDQLRAWLGNDGLNCVFIDGDKSYFDRDFYCCQPLMSKPSIAFFHDLQDEAPGGAFRHVVKDTGYHWLEVIDRTESHHALSRQEKGFEASDVHEQWLRHWAGRSAGVGVLYVPG